ncbi:MAG: electron transfer flavoprotein subunit beta/FixA family protein [Pseudomonadota bacterium]
MEIIVCIKQVPETTDVGWDPTKGTLIREGVPGILNPNDKNAIEAALQIKERYGGLVTAVSMGPPRTEEALREALSMGMDKAVLLSDSRFAGADTLATAYTLSLALKRMAGFDLVLCGKESADGMTGHIGPQLAEFLNLPQLTYATKIEIDGGSVRIRQKLDEGYRILESPLPVLITVEREINQPRIPPMDEILKAYQEKEVLSWGAEELGCDEIHLGLKGSPTQTRRVFIQKMEKGRVHFLEGEGSEIAQKFVQVLKEKGMI